MKNNNLLSVVKVFAILFITFGAALAMTGCAKQAASTDTNLIRVGVCAGPYGDMFVEAIQPELEKKGYKIKIVEFSDYVQPNNALAENEIDVNAFQHSIYLKKFSGDHGLDLSLVTEIPTAAMGIFAEKFNSIEEIANGSVIAIPNDDTNLSRALRVLAQTGVIGLNPDIDAAKATEKLTVNNVTAGAGGIELTSVEGEVSGNTLQAEGNIKVNVENWNEDTKIEFLHDCSIYSEREVADKWDLGSINTVRKYRKMFTNPGGRFNDRSRITEGVSEQ